MNPLDALRETIAVLDSELTDGESAVDCERFSPTIDPACRLSTLTSCEASAALSCAWEVVERAR